MSSKIKLKAKYHAAIQHASDLRCELNHVEDWVAGIKSHHFKQLCRCDDLEQANAELRRKLKKVRSLAKQPSFDLWSETREAIRRAINKLTDPEQIKKAKKIDAENFAITDIMIEPDIGNTYVTVIHTARDGSTIIGSGSSTCGRKDVFNSVQGFVTCFYRAVADVVHTIVNI